jgi:glycosyltransferase involved in cell wall biosynthesis
MSDEVHVVRPLVSVVTPVYNGARYLREALESLFAQDYEPFESIVVDDGSTDRTAEIARSYAVRYVRQANQGAAAARNAGLAIARGELVAFLDSDDLLPVDKLSIQAGLLAERGDIGCVLGRQEIMLEGVEAPSWLTRDAIYGDLDGIPLVSAMFRRSALDAVGLYDPTFQQSEDMDLLVRLRAHGIEIAILPEILVYRRFHGDNLTAKPPETQPLLRSLRQKLAAERASANEATG